MFSSTTHDSGKAAERRTAAEHVESVRNAVAAMAAAGIRKLDGGQIRLDAAGIRAVRAVLEDYSALLDVLPARSIIRAHRLTERRIADVLAGKRLPHDVEIVDLRGVA